MYIPFSSNYLYFSTQPCLAPSLLFLRVLCGCTMPLGRTLKHHQALTPVPGKAA